MVDKDLIGMYVDIERHGFDDREISGFVVDVSDDLVLLHYVADNFSLDGYSVIRNGDITACNLFDDPNCFQSRALRLKNVRSKRPRGINISNWNTVLESVGASYPLLVVHREDVAQDTCLVGCITNLTQDEITLHSISPSAIWDRKTRILISDVTRLDFGGGYEDALWRVASEIGNRSE